MGCVCCSLSSFISIVLDALERISLWTVCAMLTCCLSCTIITVLSIGVGIGYHYCSVQTQVVAMENAAKAAGSMRSGPEAAVRSPVMRSIDQAVRRGLGHRISRREMDVVAPPDNSISNLTLHESQNITATSNEPNYNISLFKYLQGAYH